MADATRSMAVPNSTSLVLAGLLLFSGCLERREEAPRQSAEARCTSCHGDSERPGDFVERSAPPRDLLGQSETGYPGVGAHALHLSAGPTHAAFTCTDCHVVPGDVDTPGHADSARPAELVFGPLAQTGGRSPEYDAIGRTCAETHCHRAADAVWTEPRSSAEACGSCHGLPPAAPHPQSERCFVCHGDVVDEQRNFVAPALHVDGVTQSSNGACSLCHGSDESSAPPADTRGGSDPESVGVGAHGVHLAGGSFSRPLECVECHDVPVTPEIFEHVGPLPAEVRLLGVAEANGREPVWERETTACAASWCHGPGDAASRSPSWIVAESLDCESCHALPPPPPHPHFAECHSCHAPVAGPGLTIEQRSRHVDGIVDVETELACTACHGSDDDPAPPRDLTGNSDSEAPGVGAHHVHVAGTSRSRPVACNTCHRVPSRLLAEGHVDTPGPAEVRLTGVAVAFGGEAKYTNGRCENTACHGGAFPEGNESGATHAAPLWTRVDGSQAACGGCHGLPPPAPHPRGDLNPTCSVCHENIEPDNRTFRRPELHVDGEVTFLLP
jgi:predicted CxxxxCH...CXXCH cytochrome family protein